MPSSGPEKKSLFSRIIEMTLNHIIRVIIGGVMTIVVGSIAFLYPPDLEFIGIETGKSKQHAKFEIHHENAMELISKWNHVVDIDDNSRYGVRTIRKKLGDVLIQYENLKVDKLSARFQITWHFHLARLYIINADMTSSYDNIDKAQKNLHAANELIKSPSNTEKDHKFLAKMTMAQLIRRSKMNVFALGYLIATQDENKPAIDSNKKGMNGILKVIGGCREVHSQNLVHLKLKKALGCSGGEKLEALLDV